VHLNGKIVPFVRQRIKESFKDTKRFL